MHAHPILAHQFVLCFHTNFHTKANNMFPALSPCYRNFTYSSKLFDSAKFLPFLNFEKVCKSNVCISISHLLLLSVRATWCLMINKHTCEFVGQKTSVSSLMSSFAVSLFTFKCVPAKLAWIWLTPAFLTWWVTTQMRVMELLWLGRSFLDSFLLFFTKRDFVYMLTCTF